ncbi:MAG TPA: hypothetical protein ENI76_05790 [Ignavibacteria bacterium]|nr:hypothetical protein [Ignavibacteria bacterium]
MINLNKIAHKIASSDPSVSSTVTPEITFNTSDVKEWRVNGLLHREDGPAQEYPDGDKKWWINGKLHREDGPAVEWADGGKQWWINGKLHREDGPAEIRVDGSKEWLIHGRLHREDGPAIEHGPEYDHNYFHEYDEDGDQGSEWYLNARKIEYDPETWDQKVQESKVEMVMNE